ncbi:MAG: prepilin peptidase [Candidatus Methylomirabilia bacterium]
MNPVTLGALLLGAIVGSFLNVVVARLPRKASLITPTSRCLACETPIRWFDNIPLLSFLWLKGRCRACGSPIGWRYPVVEGVTALLFVLSVQRFGLTPALIPVMLFLSALVAITAIDLEHQLIPDRITLPGIAVGFAASWVVPQPSWLDASIGILLGGGIFLVIILVSGGGMGGGDMKLGAMMGAFLGWKVTLLALLLAVVLGGTVAVVLLLTGVRGRKDPVPFGPFLAVGSLVGLFWGENLLSWYFRAFGA